VEPLTLPTPPLCGAFWHDGRKCLRPAKYVDKWERSDGKPGMRYYCSVHANGHKYTLACVWPHCKAAVVAVVDGAPLCDEHAEANATTGGWR